MSIFRTLNLSRAPKDLEGKSWPAILIGCFVSFGGILYGYDTGTISGIITMPYWMSLFSTGYTNSYGQPAVTPSQSAAVVSILSAGTFFGSLFSPFMTDRFGRRPGLLSFNIVFIFGVALQTAATALPMFLAGRFFAGLGVGLISAAIPLYQSETAPKWARGFIVGAYQFCITIGLLLAAIVDNATHKRQDTGCYRIPIAVQFAWAIILFTGLLIAPETPRYLIKRGQYDKAALSLSKLRKLSIDHPAIFEELDEIKANHEYEMSIGSASYLDCFRGGMLKRQLTGMLLAALQQTTGINFIIYYGTMYFKNSGVKNPFLIQVITDTVNCVSTLPGLYAIDILGRRRMLFWGAVGMCLSQLAAGLLGTLSVRQETNGIILVQNRDAQRGGIFFVCMFLFFFASTWGPLTWVVAGELYPLKHRAKSLSMVTASNWILNWALSYSTPFLVDYGPGDDNLQSKVLFIWFGFLVFTVVFVWFFIYETKGLSLEQVDVLYEEVKWAHKSLRWKPNRTFAHAHDDKEQTEGKLTSGQVENVTGKN